MCLKSISIACQKEGPSRDGGGGREDPCKKPAALSKPQAGDNKKEQNFPGQWKEILLDRANLPKCFHDP